jgi:hypothetical protein
MQSNPAHTSLELGDANWKAVIDIRDVEFLIDHLFQRAPKLF